jgi:hypothetical protein
MLKVEVKNWSNLMSKMVHYKLLKIGVKNVENRAL